MAQVCFGPPCSRTCLRVVCLLFLCLSLLGQQRDSGNFGVNAPGAGAPSSPAVNVNQVAILRWYAANLTTRTLRRLSSLSFAFPRQKQAAIDCEAVEGCG